MPDDQPNLVITDENAAMIYQTCGEAVYTWVTTVLDRVPVQASEQDRLVFAQTRAEMQRQYYEARLQWSNGQHRAAAEHMKGLLIAATAGDRALALVAQRNPSWGEAFLRTVQAGRDVLVEAGRTVVGVARAASDIIPQAAAAAGAGAGIALAVIGGGALLFFMSKRG